MGEKVQHLPLPVTKPNDESARPIIKAPQKGRICQDLDAIRVPHFDRKRALFDTPRVEIAAM